MRVAVEELDGVADAEVSLEEGRVTVTLEPGNTVTVAGIREAIRHQGFSPRDAEVRVSGRVEASGAGFVLRAPGSPTYRLLAGQDVATLLRSAVGTVRLLAGRVPVGDGGAERFELHVTVIEEP